MNTSNLIRPVPGVGSDYAERKVDNSDSTIFTLASIISHLAQISTFSRPDTLLRFAAKNMPSLIGSTGCSIYLRPDLALNYTGLLQDENRQLVKAKDIAEEFVVLSATTRLDLEPLIGKAFYPIDQGLSRRVLGQGLPLRLKNYTDPQEQLAAAPGLQWRDRYGDEKYYRRQGQHRPLLIVPLTAKIGALGFAVFPATVDDRPFTRVAEELAVIAAQSLANALERAWYIREQDHHIRHLVDIGAKHQPGEIYEAVTQRLGSMLNTRECQFYARIDSGSAAQLVAEDGRTVDLGTGKTYRPGQDVIGWVFKTGFPLLIPDTNEFICGGETCTVDLGRLILGARLNSEDGVLKCEQPLPGPASLLAVPVQNHNGLVLGVLSCRRMLNNQYRPGRPFDQDDLHVALSFAGMIALAIERERQERISSLLTELGLCSDPARMFELVVSRMPQLISALDSNIYLLETGNGMPARLRLSGTSNVDLASMIQAPVLTYLIGEGKTGFCALARNTLVVNHYGIGEADRHFLETERSCSRASHPNDLLEKLVDERGRMVGLITLKQGSKASLQIQQAFHTLARQQVAHQADGLTSPKLTDYQRWGVRPAWSFTVVPIKSDQNELHGVISVRRSVPSTPFSADDLALIESIAGRLASAIHTVKVQERQNRLMVTLAHEINTPLQGIMADAENLMFELPERQELNQLASHTLQQVQQLHLLTETIMTVLSERTPTRSFVVHNLIRPVKDACKMFAREAATKGCDILDPRAVDSHFPDIEMSLFDLTLAFKNLIHNAVKYSFRPPPQWEGNRYIRVIGRWADAQHRSYSVSIENYGVGIPQSEIDNRSIFLPHYRGAKASDRGRTGAGLGLAHVRQIVEDLHHGAINVTSKLMAGEAYLTTFTVILPVNQAAMHSDKKGEGNDHEKAHPLD